MVSLLDYILSCPSLFLFVLYCGFEQGALGPCPAASLTKPQFLPSKTKFYTS